jgi:hypothetical protein
VIERAKIPFLFQFQVAGLVPHLETKLLVGESIEEENRFVNCDLQVE